MKTNSFKAQKKLLKLFFVCILIFFSYDQILIAQEQGKLLMKQELGYTLGGGVAGAGFGVLLWFMDPLNPDVTLRNQIKDGFIVGTSFGALFGFWMLNNSIIFPEEQIPLQEFDDLLGLNEKTKDKNKKNKLEWSIPLINFKF